MVDQNLSLVSDIAIWAACAALAAAVVVFSAHLATVGRDRRGEHAQQTSRATVLVGEGAPAPLGEEDPAAPQDAPF